MEDLIFEFVFIQFQLIAGHPRLKFFHALLFGRGNFRPVCLNFQYLGVICITMVYNRPCFSKIPSNLSCVQAVQGVTQNGALRHTTRELFR
jgi:hypothetical protein